MVYTLLVLLTASPLITPSAFKSHYETIHLPLLQSLTGPAFPLSHTRYYVPRLEPSIPPNNPANIPSGSPVPQAAAVAGGNPEPAPANATEPVYPATILMGTQVDIDFDCVAQLVFEDDKAFAAYGAVLAREDVAKKVAEDEGKFLVRERTRAVRVEGPEVTRRGV